MVWVLGDDWGRGGIFRIGIVYECMYRLEEYASKCNG